MKSIFPYGYDSFADDRDTMAEAEASRLILDNSRNADGTYRRGRDNKGFFREIASMAGGLGISPSGMFAPSPGTASLSPYERTVRYSTAPVVGPEGPAILPAVTVGPARDGQVAPDGASSIVTAIDESVKQVGRSVGLPGWAAWGLLGAGLLGIGAAVFLKKGRGKRRRR